LNNSDLLNEVSTPAKPTILRRINRKYGLQVGVPFKNSFKSVFAFEGINTDDRYINGDVFASTDKLDELKLRGCRASLNISSNSLNRRQYATAGKAFGFQADYFSITEDFLPGSTSIETEPVKRPHQWLKFKVAAEQYFGSGWFRPGYIAEVVVSNQPFFQNYFGTIINAPSFFPLQDSRTLILQNFRAFSYAAAGLRNVFTIRKNLDFRLEAYLFRAFHRIEENTNQQAEFRDNNTLGSFAATVGFVFHSPIGPVSLNTNYYDDDENTVGVLLHVGFLLFNKHSFE
jgi:NTE family protein